MLDEWASLQLMNCLVERVLSTHLHAVDCNASDS